MRQFMIFAAVLISVGCEGRLHIESEKPSPWDTRIGQAESVRVVALYDHPNGLHPMSTIVEFPDGTRRMKEGKWGEVGDEFKAYKTKHDRYWLNDDPLDSSN